MAYDAQQWTKERVSVTQPSNSRNQSTLFQIQNQTPFRYSHLHTNHLSNPAPHHHQICVSLSSSSQIRSLSPQRVFRDSVDLLSEVLLSDLVWYFGRTSKLSAFLGLAAFNSEVILELVLKP